MSWWVYKIFVSLVKSSLKIIEIHNFAIIWWYCSDEVVREVKASDGMTCVTKEVCEVAL